jgi:hypothetical protein
MEITLYDDRFCPGFACDAALTVSQEGKEDIDLLIGDTYLYIYTPRHQKPMVINSKDIMGCEPMELKDIPELAEFQERITDLIEELNSVEEYDDEGEEVEGASDVICDAQDALINLVEALCDDEDFHALIERLL